MFSVLKKALGTWSTNHSRTSADASLFSGSAYFSSRVPKTFIDKWVAHGGEVSTGTALDARARYFFAVDPSEPWVTKLFTKSVVVIHAGWIVHCVDEAFQVPLAEYILDDRFVRSPPYKLTDTAPTMYVPLYEPGGPTDVEYGPTPAQTSDTPSTPTSLRRKRKREQAYFDSPSGSLVFTGFDKDGMPRRPRKQRKLWFDQSFSPEGDRSSKETIQGAGLHWLWDYPDTFRDEDDLSEERSQNTGASTVCGPSHATAVRLPNTPDKPLAHGELFAPYRRFFSSQEHRSEPTRLSSPVISVDVQKRVPPIRTIDFTNLPPPTRRWRFPQSNVANSGGADMTPSAVRPTEHEVKTPKKISFANHAQVRVYMVSPFRSHAKDSAGPGPVRQCFGGGFENRPRVSDKARMSSDEVGGSDSPTADATKELVPQVNSPKVNGGPGQLPGGNQFEDDAIKLTLEEVYAMRCRLLESAAKNGMDDGQIAALFELGKTFRGMAFHHVW